MILLAVIVAVVVVFGGVLLYFGLQNPSGDTYTIDVKFVP